MQLEDLNFEQLFKRAKKAERLQNASELNHILKPVWKFGSEPELSKFPAPERAGLLRYIGSSLVLVSRLEGNLDHAKRGEKTLRASIKEFSSLNLQQEAAEVQSVLANIYVWEGKIAKALKMIEASECGLAPDCYEHFYNQTQKMTIKSWLGEHEEAKNIFYGIRNPISLYGDENLRAWFNSKVSSMYWFTGELEKALFYIEKTIRLAKRVGNRMLTAIALNNAAGIYGDRKDFNKAHELANHSYRIFKVIDSKTGLSHVLDTEAQVFLDECNYVKAEETINLAISLFEETGSYVGHADAIFIKIKILLKTHRCVEAIEQSEDLKNFALEHLGKEAYHRFDRLLDELLGSYDLRPHQVVQVSKGPVKSFREKSHFTFKSLADPENQEIVAVNCDSIEAGEKYVVKCKKSGRFFLGEIYFDPTLKLLYIEDRPLRTGGFQVFGRVQHAARAAYS